ncbi:MAG: biopolymer transporter ExbD [Acidobacteria bacterium]|nr:biopolymer transporter ExbD [Acidobacteriota bacterium]
MGLTVGNGKGSIADPNIVPLIDILLVMIIIFMAITPTVPKGHMAQLPQPAEKIEAPKVPDNTAVVVEVLAGGALRMNGEPHTWTSLGPRLDAIFKQRAPKVAFVQGENAVLFQDVARAIDIMRSSGVDRVGLLTAKITTGH